MPQFAIDEVIHVGPSQMRSFLPSYVQRKKRRKRPTAAERFRQPRTLAQFELTEQLGVGAFGTVWKARDTKLDRVVAVKIPRKDQLSEEDAEKFFREARMAAQVKHPNIVGVHEIGREDDSLYIVSDYVEGLTLGDC